MSTEAMDILTATELTRSAEGNGSRILNGVDVSIRRGEFVVIMGSSGAGKSSLLYCLSALDSPSSGAVRLSGERVDSLSESALSRVRRSIGFVFQQINLLPHLTLLENVALPALLSPERAQRKSAFARARDLLARVGLEDAADRRPAQTSGGQQQRAAVARALIGDPSILFADEPTGALNSAAGAEVLELFDSVHASGQTVVMVTHDPKAAARGQRVLYMIDGRIHGELDLTRADDPDHVLLQWLLAMGW